MDADAVMHELDMHRRNDAHVWIDRQEYDGLRQEVRDLHHLVDSQQRTIDQMLPRVDERVLAAEQRIRRDLADLARDVLGNAGGS